MSLEIIDRLLKNWKNPEYKGFTDKLSHFQLARGIRSNPVASRAQSNSNDGDHLKLNPKPIEEYSPDREGLFEFYGQCNIKMIERFYPGIKVLVYILRRPIPIAGIDLTNKYLMYDMENILEVGFKGGFSTINFLNNSKARVLSIDKFFHEYHFYGKNFIDSKFPGRHLLLTGFHKNTNTYLENYCSDVKFDFILINKSQKYDSVYRYLTEYKKYAHKNTIIHLFGVSPHRSWGIGSYMAMNRAISEGLVTMVEYVKLDQWFWESSVILKYNFNPDYVQKLPLKLYINMEIAIPITEFADVLKFNFIENTGKVTPELVKQYKDKFAEYDIKFDDYVLEILKEKYNIIIDI